MPSKVIRKVADLPEWFRLKEYKKRLSAQEWHNSIYIRYSAKSLFASIPGYIPKVESAESTFLEMIDIPIETNRLLALSLEGGAEPPIQDMPVLDALYFSSLPEQFEYENVRAALNRLITEARKCLWAPNEPKGSLVPYEYEKLLSDTIDELQTIDPNFGAAIDYLPNPGPLLSYGTFVSGLPISVNLDFDDETIINAFKSWLKDARTKIGIKAPRPFKQSDFDEWERCRILQVFDLDFWAKITETRITDGALAKALWPDNDPDAEDITPVDLLRKTSRKKVRALINRDALDRLKAQVLLEEDNLDGEVK